MASAVILDPLERQEILSKTPILLNVVRLDAPHDLSSHVIPKAAPTLSQASPDGAVDDASSNQYSSGVSHNIMIQITYPTIVSLRLVSRGTLS